MKRFLFTLLRLRGAARTCALLAIVVLTLQRSDAEGKPPPAATVSETLNVIATIENSRVCQRAGDTAFLFKGKMAVDADGAPNTYHPISDMGLDDLANGGRPGNWWAVVTDNGQPDGQPILQGPNDPAPGFYVSTTSLMDETKPVTDPHRYVDATAIPFFVLPPPIIKLTDSRLGDFAVVWNTQNDKIAYAIFADVGPFEKIGEGSIALAKALGINPDARNGGTGQGIVYLVFPRSGNEKPRPAKVIDKETKRRLKSWGGLSRLKTLSQQL